MVTYTTARNYARGIDARRADLMMREDPWQPFCYVASDRPDVQAAEPEP